MVTSCFAGGILRPPCLNYVVPYSYTQLLKHSAGKNLVSFIMFNSCFLKNTNLFIWQHWVFIAAHGLSLVAARRGYSLVLVPRLLTAAVSPIAEQRLSSCAQGLSILTICGILLDQGSNQCPLHWQADSYNHWTSLIALEEFMIILHFLWSDLLCRDGKLCECRNHWIAIL